MTSDDDSTLDRPASLEFVAATVRSFHRAKDYTHEQIEQLVEAAFDLVQVSESLGIPCSERDVIEGANATPTDTTFEESLAVARAVIAHITDKYSDRMIRNKAQGKEVNRLISELFEQVESPERELNS